MSRTVKQPIRAELNIEPHCESANQSRAQESTLLFMTFPNKPITDCFTLGRNPRVVNLHLHLCI